MFSKYLEDDEKFPSRCSKESKQLDFRRESKSQTSHLIEIFNYITIRHGSPIETSRSERLSHVPERWTGEDFELISGHKEQDPSRYKEFRDINANK